MSALISIILGTLQGLTEFLPVSSSGHLVIMQEYLPNFQQPGVLFDVILHAGTLLSVLVFFRKKLFSLGMRYLMLLALGTIPAVFIGFLFKDIIEGLFTNLKVVGVSLVVTGVMNYFTDSFHSISKKIKEKDAIIIGLFQAIAIIPGISRSGSTIFAGSKMNIERSKAAEFSFLLSIPAVFGANVLQLYLYRGSIDGNIAGYLPGFIAAFIAGYCAIYLVYKFLTTKKFKIFAFYTIILGFTILLMQF